jgi:hypothetical protein
MRALTMSKQGYVRNNKEFSWIRKQFASAISKTNTGRKSPHNEETKIKIGNALRGKPKSAAHKIKINESKVGRKQSEEHIAKRMLHQTGERNHNYGKPMDDDTKQKISQAKKGKGWTQARRDAHNRKTE